MPANLENSEWPQDWKRSVFLPIPMKGNAKECSNYRTITLISHASKVMLNILQDRLHQYLNWEFPDVQAWFRKDRVTRNQIATSAGSLKKQESSRNTSTSASLTAFDCVDHSKLWKLLKEIGIPDHLIMPPEKSACRLRSNSLNWTWNNGLVPNWERSTLKLYIVTLLMVLLCRVPHAKCQAGWSTSWNPSCRQKYQ